MTCEIKGEIHLITCNSCGKEHVAETQNLREKVALPSLQIKNPQY